MARWNVQRGSPTLQWSHICGRWAWLSIRVSPPHLLIHSFAQLPISQGISKKHAFTAYTHCTWIRTRIRLSYSKCPRIVKNQMFHQEPVWDEISGYSDKGICGPCERAEPLYLPVISRCQVYEIILIDFIPKNASWLCPPSFPSFLSAASAGFSPILCQLATTFLFLHLEFVPPMTMVVTLLPSSNHRLTRQTGFTQVQLRPPPSSPAPSSFQWNEATASQIPSTNTDSDLLPVFGDSESAEPRTQSKKVVTPKSGAGSSFGTFLLGIRRLRRNGNWGNTQLQQKVQLVKDQGIDEEK